MVVAGGALSLFVRNSIVFVLEHMGYRSLFSRMNVVFCGGKEKFWT